MPKRHYNLLKSLAENNGQSELQSLILKQELKFGSKLRGHGNHISVSEASKQITICQLHIGKENIYKKRKMADGDENKVIRLNSFVENDVQHLLNDQIRIREGAMKLMSACSTLNQALETSKNLLTINAKILGLMCALQKQKQECVLNEYNRSRSYSTVSRAESCTGQVAISDIRVPVMWKDNVHFTGKTGDQSFYAFALIRCGDEVRDTPLYEVTSTDTDMYFDEPLVFEDLQSDFKMEFELYYTVITANERYGFKVPSKGSMNIKKRAVQFNAPKFALAGHTQLVVDDIKTGVLSKDLLIGSKGASGVAVLGDASEFPAHPLELWGQFCCQLAAVPVCMREETFLGNCYVSNVDDEFKEQFLVLYQCELSCWLDQTMYSRNNKPIDAIKLTQNTEITKDGSNICIKSQDTEKSFRFTDESTCSKSLLALENCVLNLQVWKLACEEVMHIPQNKKNKMALPSKASFYDQIVIEKVTTPDLLRSNSSQSNPVLSVYNEHHTKIKETESDMFSSVFEDSIQKIPDAHFEGSLPIVFEHICQNDSVSDSTTPEQIEHTNSPNKNAITPHTSIRSLSDAHDNKDNLSDEFSYQKSDIFNSDIIDNAEKMSANFVSTTHGVEIPLEGSKVFFTESNSFNHTQSSDLIPSELNNADNVPNSNLAAMDSNYVGTVSNLTTNFFNYSDTESDHSSTEPNLAASNVNIADSIQESDLAVVVNESNHADHSSTECNLAVPNLNIADSIQESGLSVVVTESNHADRVQKSNFVTADDEDVKNANFSEVEANHPDNVTNYNNAGEDHNHSYYIHNSNIAVGLNHFDQVHKSNHVVEGLNHLDLTNNLIAVIDNSNHPDHVCSSNFEVVQIQSSVAVNSNYSDHFDSFPNPVIPNIVHSQAEPNVFTDPNNVCITQFNLSEIKYEAPAIVATDNDTEIVHVSNNISDISLNSDVGDATKKNRIDITCQTKDNENVVGSNIIENLNKTNDTTTLIEESSRILSDTNLKFTNDVENYPHNVNEDFNEASLNPISSTGNLTYTYSEAPLTLNDFTSNFQPSDNNNEISDSYQGHVRGLETAQEKHDKFVSEIAEDSEDFSLENDSSVESSVQLEKSGDVKENFPPGSSEAHLPEFTETNLLRSVQHSEETEVKGELADTLPL